MVFVTSLIVIAATLMLIWPSSCCEFITTTLPQSATGACKPYTWSKYHSPGAATPTIEVARPTHTYAVPWKLGSDVQGGEIFCRQRGDTYEDADSQSCEGLAKKYRTSLDKLYFLNPQLAPDCEGIRQWTSYCVHGCKFFILQLSPYWTPLTCESPQSSTPCALTTAGADPSTEIQPALA